MRELTQEQAQELGRTPGLRGYNRGRGWSKELIAALKTFSDQLLASGPGKKPKNLRSTTPKREVLFSSDYIEKVFS